MELLSKAYNREVTYSLENNILLPSNWVLFKILFKDRTLSFPNIATTWILGGLCQQTRNENHGYSLDLRGLYQTKITYCSKYFREKAMKPWKITAHHSIQLYEAPDWRCLLKLQSLPGFEY